MLPWFEVGLCSCIGGFRLPIEGLTSTLAFDGPACDVIEGSLGGALAMVGGGPPDAADTGRPGTGCGDCANVRDGGLTGGKLAAAEVRDSTPEQTEWRVARLASSLKNEQSVMVIR